MTGKALGTANATVSNALNSIGAGVHSDFGAPGAVSELMQWALVGCGAGAPARRCPARGEIVQRRAGASPAPYRYTGWEAAPRQRGKREQPFCFLG